MDLVKFNEVISKFNHDELLATRNELRHELMDLEFILDQYIQTGQYIDLEFILDQYIQTGQYYYTNVRIIADAMEHLIHQIEIVGNHLAT